MEEGQKVTCEGVVLPAGMSAAAARRIASLLKDYQDDVGDMAGKSDIEAAVMVFLACSAGCPPSQRNASSL